MILARLLHECRRSLVVQLESSLPTTPVHISLAERLLYGLPQLYFCGLSVSKLVIRLKSCLMRKVADRLLER